MWENLYMILDRAAGIYLKPILVSRNDVAPTREFKDLINNPETIFAKNHDQFELMALGAMNLETGEIAPHEPRLVVKGDDLRTK